MDHPLLRIALTPGEPAGIGPDLCIQLAQQNLSCELVVIANTELMLERAQLLGLPLTLNVFDSQQACQAHQPGHLSIIPVELPAPGKAGKLNAQNSRYVLKTITKAVKGCMDGQFSAMVTAPANKNIINDAGMPFTGHTELVADLTDGPPVMVLSTERLRVHLAPVHFACIAGRTVMTPTN